MSGWIFIFVYIRVTVSQIRFSTFLAPQKAPSRPFSVNISSKGNHYSDLYHHRSIWPILKFHINAIPQSILFCAWLLFLKEVKFIHVILCCVSQLLFHHYVVFHYRDKPHCIHSTADSCLVGSSFKLLLSKLQWRHHYTRLLVDTRSLFLLATTPETELLDHKVFIIFTTDR